MLNEEDLFNFISNPPTVPPSVNGFQSVFHGCSILVLEFSILVFSYCLHHYKGSKESVKHLLEMFQVILPIPNNAPKTFHELTQVLLVFILNICIFLLNLCQIYVKFMINSLYILILNLNVVFCIHDLWGQKNRILFQMFPSIHNN
jgi:hypothetical protein